MHGLPLKMRFRKSRLYISALMPAGIGFFVGILSAIMGVGGAFIMVPAMIYLLGMPTASWSAPRCSRSSSSAANVTFLQAVQNQTVDLTLALALTVGGVIGAQIGGRLGAKLPGEQLRVLLAALILFVAIRLAWELGTRPAELYSVMWLAPPG